jgi:hypothetical protein
MQSVNNKKFDEAMQNDYYTKILNKVSNENLKGICSKDEMKSIMMSTLWGCIQKYNNTKNVKFSSYLYRSIQNNTRRIYKNKAKQFKEVSLIDNFHSLVVDNKAIEEARDIIMSLKDKNEELHNIIIQKFFYNMTNKEIGQANGYGKEAARKKLKKALELCREIVYSNVGTGT